MTFEPLLLGAPHVDRMSGIGSAALATRAPGPADVEGWRRGGRIAAAIGGGAGGSKSKTSGPDPADVEAMSTNIGHGPSLVCRHCCFRGVDRM